MEINSPDGCGTPEITPVTKQGFFTQSRLLNSIPSLVTPGPLGRWALAGLSLIVLCACGGGTQDPDLIVSDQPIGYVLRSIPVDQNGDPVQEDARVKLEFNPGAVLYVRERALASAAQTDVTSRAWPKDALYDVKDVEISYDGKMLVFAMRAPEPEMDPIPTWNIWVYDIPTNRLKRVIVDDIIAEDGEDLGPHFLPDGRIILTSTRQRQTLQNLVDEGRGQILRSADENRNEYALSLHIMNIDCSTYDTCNVVQPGDVVQSTFNMSHDFDPSVIPSTGEIVFTRWDHAATHDEMSLYKMHPDGTELQMLYGVHINSHDSGTNNATIQFIKPRQAPDGRILTIVAPFSGTNLGGDILYVDVDNFIDIDQPTWANQGAGGSGQASATANDVRTDGGISRGGRFLSFFPLYDGSNRAVVTWSSCRLIDPDTSAVVPCTDANLAKPNPQEAPPLYGIYLYNMGNNTQVPLLTPPEGFMYTEVVAAQEITRPPLLVDKTPGVELNQGNYDKAIGTLRIISVYDFGDQTLPLNAPVNPADATACFSGLCTSVPGLQTLAALADPASYADPADASNPNAFADRPARFLRVLKAVNLPTSQELNLAGTAFGRSRAQGMREIVGYAPIEPDGSVNLSVPANVPLMISVLDAAGRRIGPRHNRWLQVRPGETVTCVGCHSHANESSIPPLPHGRLNAVAPALNQGAPSNGYTFPNTVGSIFADAGDTMADARVRLDATARLPKADIIYDDVWTDSGAAQRVIDPSFAYEYAQLTHLVSDPDPALNERPACITYREDLCRVILNYAKNIHPLWNADRGANTCTSCHSTRDAANALRVPAGQLNLSDANPNDDPNAVAAHKKAYRELLFNDNSMVLSGGMLVDGRINPVSGLEELGQFTINASMSTAGARASYFMEKMTNTELNAGRALSGMQDHTGMLDAHELKLIAEWLDIGAQYFNDPYDPDVPLN